MDGAVYDPYRDELFGAAYGKVAWLETAGKRTPLAVSASMLGDAIVYAGAPPGMRALKPSLRGIAAVAPHVRTMRLLGSAAICVEINQCVGCTKSFLGDDAAVLARSSGKEPASPRHRAGVASMAWRTTR